MIEGLSPERQVIAQEAERAIRKLSIARPALALTVENPEHIFPQYVNTGLNTGKTKTSR